MLEPGTRAGRVPHVTVRLADGRTYTGPLDRRRQRANQIGLLHRDSDGLLELAAGPRRDGRLAIWTRYRADHYLPGGRHAASTPSREWLAAPLAMAEGHVAAGHEVFVGPAVRRPPRPDPDRPGRVIGGAATVAATRWLWVDADEPEAVARLRDLHRERPALLLVASGGHGDGMHAYWLLADPLTPDEEAIERANRRLAHAVGGDPQVVNRDRVLRLAGTVNGKTGRHARILLADFGRTDWALDELLGDLPDPPRPVRATPVAPRGTWAVGDRYRSIAAADWVWALLGQEGRLIHCPSHPILLGDRTGTRPARSGTRASTASATAAR